jgi:hypothetical protein
MTCTKTFATLLLLLTLSAHASAQTPAATQTPTTPPPKAQQPRQPKGEAARTTAVVTLARAALLKKGR